jgi:hypothetical protein
MARALFSLAHNMTKDPLPPRGFIFLYFLGFYVCVLMGLQAHSGYGDEAMSMESGCGDDALALPCDGAPMAAFEASLLADAQALAHLAIGPHAPTRQATVCSHAEC